MSESSGSEYEVYRIMDANNAARSSRRLFRSLCKSFERHDCARERKLHIGYVLIHQHGCCRHDPEDTTTSNIQEVQESSSLVFSLI